MDDNNKYTNYNKNPSFSDLKQMFNKYNSNIIIYGHNHNRLISFKDDKYFINPGSLGCPSNDKDIARAIILEINENISFKLIENHYNVYDVIESIKKLNYPSKDEILKIFYGV